MDVEALAECSELVSGPFVIQEIEDWYLVNGAFSKAMFGGPGCACYLVAKEVAVGPFVWLANCIVKVPLV